MNGKIGLRAFSMLLAVMLVSVVLVPAVSASDSKSKDEQMSNRSASEKAPVHFGDLTEMRIADEKEVYAKIPSSIKNYDLVVFDLPKIREHLLHGDQLTVYLEGQPYTMDLQETTIDTEAIATGIHSFTGSLTGVEDSQVLLTVGNNVLLGRIVVDYTEYFIESTSTKDSKSSGAFLQYVYSSKDIFPEGDTIPIDSHSLSTHAIDEEAYALKKMLEEQADPRATVTVRVLVATDSKWMTDEPDWQDTAAAIIQYCNYDFNTLGVNIVPTYDTSKAQQLSNDPQVISSPLSTFKNHFPDSILIPNSATSGLILVGNDSSSQEFGSWGGFNNSSLNRNKTEKTT